MKKIAASLFFGCGVGLLLFGTKNDLPLPAYLINIPFWPVVVVPTGLIWKNKIMTKINEGQFPPQMRSYRQMFIVSKKAIIYELFLNQIGYHTLLGITFMAYTYYARPLYDEKTPRKSFSQLMSSSIAGFFKLRFLFATVSILSQFWGARLNIIKAEGGFHLSSNTKRALLLKQTLLTLLWMTSVTNLVHINYALDENKSSNSSIKSAH